jgi:hypothetical protein
MAELVFACSRCRKVCSTSDELTAHVARRHRHAVKLEGPTKRVDGWVPPAAAASSASGRVFGRPLARLAPPAEADGPAHARRASCDDPPIGDARWTRLAAAWPPATILACLGLVAGALTLSVAYNWAATHGSGTLHYDLFWVGEFVFLVPAMVRLCSRHASRAERLGLLVMVGLFSYLPKLLRDPTGPLFQDELIHWHQAQAMFSAGKVFVPSQIIGIVEYFPGLQLLAVQLRHLTGLSTFATGSVLLALLHVVSLVGVFMIVERLTRSSWIAGIAALVYSLNPGFMFFDSQFSYESLSVVFFIWVIACVVGVQTARGRPGERGAWLTVGLILAAGCIVTHHLATYILIAALILVAVVTAARDAPRRRDLALTRRQVGDQRRETRRRLRLTWVFATLVLAGAAVWAALVATGTVAYLAPSVAGGVHELAALLRHEAGSRHLFSGSTVPVYERIAAFVTPVALALGAVGGLRILWRLRRQAPPAWVGLALFGLLYFAALPLMFTVAGSEGARRSWAYSYLGLSVLLAPLLAALIVGARGRVRRGALVALIVVLLGAILVGNVSIQMDPEYRFPGPYVYGSDTRSLTPELLGMTTWFRTTQGAGQKVVADRDCTLALASFGDELTAAASPAFPIWQLYFLPGAPDARLIGELSSSGYRYLIIDRRMSQSLPAIGVYFVPNEPEGSMRTTPVPAAAIQKYESLPWVTKIYASNNLEVYRFDFTEFGARTAPSVVTAAASGKSGARKTTAPGAVEELP